MFGFKKHVLPKEAAPKKVKKEVLPERKTAMAEYVADVEMVDGSHKRFCWQGFPSRYLYASNRPHSQMGFQYVGDGKEVFIPWHQIKKSSLTETLLWDDCPN